MATLSRFCRLLISSAESISPPHGHEHLVPNSGMPWCAPCGRSKRIRAEISIGGWNRWPAITFEPQYVEVPTGPSRSCSRPLLTVTFLAELQLLLTTCHLVVLRLVPEKLSANTTVP